MRLQIGCCLCCIIGGDHPTQPPTGHGVALGNAIDHDGAVLNLWNQLGYRVGPLAVIDQVLVDLIGYDPEVFLGGNPVTDGDDLLFRVDGAGWVRWRAQQQRLGLVCVVSLKLVNGDLVALVTAGKDIDLNTTG